MLHVQGTITVNVECAHFTFSRYDCTYLRLYHPIFLTFLAAQLSIYIN